MEFFKLLALILSLSFVHVFANEDADVAHKRIPKDMCKIVMEKFSQTVASYTECTSKFARPIQLCLRCRDAYMAVHHAYDYMEDFKQDNVSCATVLLKQDRLGVINQAYTWATGPESLWAKASCSNCYEDNNIEKDKANHTVTFESLWNETIACFKEFLDLQLFTDDPQGYKSSPLTKNHADNSSNICNNCSQIYDKLRNFFWDEVVPSSPTKTLGGVCYDLRDRFNLTGIIWKEESHCEPRPYWWWLIPACIINLLVIFFTYTCEPYIIPYFFPRHAQERVNLVQQDAFDGEIYEVDADDTDIIGNFEVVPGVTADEWIARFRDYELTKPNGEKVIVRAPPPPEEYYDLEWDNEEWVMPPKEMLEKCVKIKRRFKRGEITLKQAERMQAKVISEELNKKQIKRKKSKTGTSSQQASASGEDVMQASSTFNDLMTSSTISTIAEADNQ